MKLDKAIGLVSNHAHNHLSLKKYCLLIKNSSRILSRFILAVLWWNFYSYFFSKIVVILMMEMIFLFSLELFLLFCDGISFPILSRIILAVLQVESGAFVSVTGLRVYRTDSTSHAASDRLNMNRQAKQDCSHIALRRSWWRGNSMGESRD